MTRKMKYYMRGIGAGIVVTALILAISRVNRPASISDEEVISRALALGMIDPGNLSLSDAADMDTTGGQVTEIDNPAGIQVIVDNEDITSGDGLASDAAGDNKEDADKEPANNNTDENSPGNNGSENTGNDNSGTDNIASAGTVTLQVFGGNSSDVVAARAQSLGLVDNADDFDRFLVNNGYANRISVGTFTIEKGADYTTIARIITNSR